MPFRFGSSAKHQNVLLFVSSNRNSTVDKGNGAASRKGKSVSKRGPAGKGTGAQAAAAQSQGLARSRSKAHLVEPLSPGKGRRFKRSVSNTLSRKKKMRQGSAAAAHPYTPGGRGAITTQAAESSRLNNSASSACVETKEQQRPTKERFKVHRQVGKGTFSTVHHATHRKTKRKVALKLLLRDKIKAFKTEDKVTAEVDHLRLCAAHPHITRLYDIIDCSSAPTLDLVMEFVSGGDLYDYLRLIKKNRRKSASSCFPRRRLSFPWESLENPLHPSGLDHRSARRFFQQLVSALGFMHSKGIVHRDLKLENLILDASHRYIKLADFGLSAWIDIHAKDPYEERLLTPCGSPHYAAPEIISGEPYLGPPVDVWSAGVILYAMLSGKLPFVESDMKKQFRKIREGSYNIPRGLSREMASMIQKMLTVNVDRRTTIENIQHHLWFQVELPDYLNCAPDETEKRERKKIDDGIMKDVFALYWPDADSSKNEKHDEAEKESGGKVRFSQDSELFRKGLEQAISLGGGLDSGMTDVMRYGETMRDAHTAYQLLLDEKHEKQRSRELFCDLESTSSRRVERGGTIRTSSNTTTKRSRWAKALLYRGASKTMIAVVISVVLILCRHPNSSNIVQHSNAAEQALSYLILKPDGGLVNATWGSFLMSWQTCFQAARSVRSVGAENALLRVRRP